MKGAGAYVQHEKLVAQPRITPDEFETTYLPQPLDLSLCKSGIFHITCSADELALLPSGANRSLAMAAGAFFHAYTHGWNKTALLVGHPHAAHIAWYYKNFPAELEEYINKLAEHYKGGFK